jgi:hypothetical protein
VCSAFAWLQFFYFCASRFLSNTLVFDKKRAFACLFYESKGYACARSAKIEKQLTFLI